MELRHLRTFRAVATLNSFNQAADVLGYAQSTVSAHIKALEDDLGVLLFIRSGKRIAPTQAGELLLQHAQRILAIEEEVRAELVDGEVPHGLLTMRIPETVSTYCLPPILTAFHELYSKVGFSFRCCTYYGLEEELRSGIIDLAFLITDTFRAPNLEIERLTQLPLVMISHPDNPLASKTQVGVQDIKNEPFLLPREDCSYGMILEKALTDGQAKPTVIMDFNSIEAIKQCVIAGTGLAPIPEIAVRAEITGGLLTALPWTGASLQDVSLFMIWHGDKWLSPTLRAFMNLAGEIIAASHAEY